MKRSAKTETVTIYRRLIKRRDVSPELSELEKHRTNIRTIMKYSNATPIRCRVGVGYACCFCHEQFPDPADLKTHTLEDHDDFDKTNFMRGSTMYSFLVKLDITSLHCTICNDYIDSLDELTMHLLDIHDEDMFTDINNHIVPFKFDDSDCLRCVFCSNNFSKFKGLLEHMNTHYRNYVCDVCDAGFVTKYILFNHAATHKTGLFECCYCEKVFDTLRKKQLHEKAIHIHCYINKCGHCGERFKDFRQKEDHIAKMHGVPATLKCQACDRTFKNKSMYTIHIKRDHLLERPHKCAECDMGFYKEGELKKHMVKHTGVRDFKCILCSKAFGRQESLKAHVRIHMDERKYKCRQCDLSFVHRGSLHTHMRTYHHH